MGGGGCGSAVRAPHCQPRGQGVESTCGRFETWAISFTPFCLCLLEDTVIVVGNFNQTRERGPGVAMF